MADMLLRMTESSREPDSRRERLGEPGPALVREQPQEGAHQEPP